MDRPRIRGSVWFVAALRRLFRGVIPASRLTRAPGVGAVAEHLLFRGDDLMVLPRRRVVRIERPIPEVEHQVLPSQVLEHFVRSTPHLWLMERCLCRDGAGCEDYPRDLGCLFLGQAAMKINPRLGRPVTEAEALAHLARCREAGLVHLVGRNRLDTVWLGVGPGHRLLTVCNCCPCCCLWRILPHVRGSIAEKVTRMPGVTVQVGDACEGCGRCAESCFVQAIRLDGPRAQIGESCRGCGRCVSLCPSEAIELRIASGALQRSIDRIGRVVDLR